jgi:hypothetical protein
MDKGQIRIQISNRFQNNDPTHWSWEIIEGTQWVAGDDFLADDLKEASEIAGRAVADFFSSQEASSPEGSSPEGSSPEASSPEGFTEGHYLEFDEVRRLGVCNMLDRRSVEQAADFQGLEALAAVAADKKLYPKLLVWFISESQKRGN